MGPKKRGASGRDPHEEAKDLTVEEKRVLQNRLAQRAFRERKDNRIKELEAEVASLKAQLLAYTSAAHTPPASSGHPLAPCQTCFAEKIKVDELTAKVTVLQSENLRLSALYSTSLITLQDMVLPWNTSKYNNPVTYGVGVHRSGSSSGGGPSVSPAAEATRQISSAIHHHPLLQPPPAPAAPEQISNLFKQFGVTLPDSKHEWEELMMEDPFRTPNSESIFGPAQVEFYRISLKSLASLERHPEGASYVDGIFDTFVIQSRLTNEDEIRKCAVKMLTLRSKLIDACGLEDRLVLLDLIERFRHQNKDHVHYMYSICGKIGGGGGGCGGGSGGGDGGGAGAAIAVAIAPTVATEGISPSMPKEIPETAGRAYTRSVKRAIGLVPSLKGCRLVDQLCDLFEKQAQCEDPETRAAMIYKYIKARSDILDHCATIEVKNKVQVALEIGRDQNKKLVDDMYKSIVNSL